MYCAGRRIRVFLAERVVELTIDRANEGGLLVCQTQTLACDLVNGENGIAHLENPL
jgi:hypothetical protein